MEESFPQKEKSEILKGISMLSSNVSWSPAKMEYTQPLRGCKKTWQKIFAATSLCPCPQRRQDAAQLVKIEGLGEVKVEARLA